MNDVERVNNESKQRDNEVRERWQKLANPFKVEDLVQSLALVSVQTEEEKKGEKPMDIV